MSDDLISRQAAIALADEYQSEDAWEIRDRIAHEMPSVGRIPESEFRIFLDAVPTADVQEIKRSGIVLSGAYDSLMGMLSVREWIPCSESLPEEPFGCLVTVWDTDPISMDDFENLLPYFVGWDGEQWNDGDGIQCPFEVIAWMPLPEPYKEKENE